MDDFSALQRLAQQIAQSASASGRRVTRYSADNGVITGFRVRPGRVYHEERRYTSGGVSTRREWWGTVDEVILCRRTGDLYEYSVAFEESGTPARRTQRRTLRRLGPRDLVGSSGLPFSEITEALRRVPPASAGEIRIRARRRRPIAARTA